MRRKAFILAVKTLLKKHEEEVTKCCIILFSLAISTAGGILGLIINTITGFSTPFICFFLGLCLPFLLLLCLFIIICVAIKIIVVLSDLLEVFHHFKIYYNDELEKLQ